MTDLGEVCPTKCHNWVHNGVKRVTYLLNGPFGHKTTNTSQLMVGNNNNTNKTVTSYILTINWLEID